MELFKQIEKNYRAVKGRQGFASKSNPLRKSYKLRLTEKEHRALMAMAEKENTTASNFIRKCIKKYIVDEHGNF